MKRRKPSHNARFDQPKEVRAIARERVGTVKPSRAIVPKSKRKKPKPNSRPAQKWTPSRMPTSFFLRLS
jgi:hypothetical protein